MARNMITCLHSLATNVLNSIRAPVQAPFSSSSNYNNSEKNHARVAEEDLKFVMRTLERIKAVMFDAEGREIRDLSVNLWLKELKEVAYDAEDVLSEYRDEVTRVQVKARNASEGSDSHKRKQIMEYNVPIPDGIVDRLDKIRSRFDEITNDRKALLLFESDGVWCPNNKEPLSLSPQKNLHTKMAGNLITSQPSVATNLLPSITASAQAPSYSSNPKNSEMGRARAAEEGLERLMRTLERIKATLYDAEQREIRDPATKMWLKELKMVAYDAEDVLSEYQYEVTRVHVQARKASQASGSHKREHMEYIVPIPDGIVDWLNKIRSRFDEIANDRVALQLMESDGVRRPNNKILLSETNHMVDEANIFGRDAEISKVIEFLLSGKEKSFSVISIIGKGGLGKTSIAQLVYKDQRVSWQFDLFGWVCVSENFDVKRLIKETIESISNKINNGVSEFSQLQEELAKVVNGKKLLLVLDDVWNENQSLWELFQVSFKEAKMVRILVTTQNKKVAEIMQTTAYCRPNKLSEDSCWQLFQHYAFSGTSDAVPTHLVDMGRKIMRKCGGLPLVVKSIANLLRHETYEEDWREILESDLWELDPLNYIFPTIQISYAHLPAYLRPCFLFCSMYPKDYLMEKMNLIELWISHGYIQSKDTRKNTEIGVEYYEELKERLLLDDFSYGSSQYCKLRDITHDLARLNSGNQHYSVEIKQPINDTDIIQQEVYHLFVRGFVGYVNQILQQNMKGLRTLSLDLIGCNRGLENRYCINNTEAMGLNSKLPEFYKEWRADISICNLTKFEALRVLELKGDFTEIPDFIPQLKHLVYLRITSFYLKMLPVSIGLLYNLQTLILNCFSLQDLPESIGDLAKLQFLNIQSSKAKKLSKSLCLLSNLLRLDIRSDQLEEVPLDLRNLTNLRELTILSNRIQALPSAICHLSSLEELKLLPIRGSVKNNYKLNYVPHGHANFPAIKTMAAWLRVRSISWLKDMNDLEGKLSIEGLEKMNNSVDVWLAKLRNKCKLETLDLCWDSGNYEFPYDAKSELILSLQKGFKDGSVGADYIDFSLLECLQPHPNLKKLLVRWYPSARIPEWMRDPSSFHSIQEVLLECCKNIQFLPFGKLHTLKHVKIQACSSIRVIQLEQLSSQLEKLQILQCGHLELITGLGNLVKLATLKISSCKNLKSLMMDGLQLVGSTEPIGDFSHEMPQISCQSISALTRLEIEDCDLLHVLPDRLIPSGPCYVRVRGCGCHDI